MAPNMIAVKTFHIFFGSGECLNWNIVCMGRCWPALIMRGRYERCKFSNLFVVHTEVGGEANPVSKGHFGGRMP